MKVSFKIKMDNLQICFKIIVIKTITNWHSTPCKTKTKIKTITKIKIKTKIFNKTLIHLIFLSSKDYKIT